MFIKVKQKNKKKKNNQTKTMLTSPLSGGNTNPNIVVIDIKTHGNTKLKI